VVHIASHPQKHCANSDSITKYRVRSTLQAELAASQLAQQVRKFAEIKETQRTCFESKLCVICREETIGYSFQFSLRNRSIHSYIKKINTGKVKEKLGHGPYYRNVSLVWRIYERIGSILCSRGDSFRVCGEQYELALNVDSREGKSNLKRKIFDAVA
jgi:hypothetical protein